MKFARLLAFVGLSAFLASSASADVLKTIPSTSTAAVWDTTTGSLYGIGINGQGSTLTVIPNQATANTWTGANNFTGTFSIGGTAQTFPASGLIVGTTDTQTLSAKTLTAPVVNTSLTLAIGTTAPLFVTTASLQNGAASAAGTLTNAPSAGNPTKWIPINDNGTTRYIPAW